MDVQTGIMMQPTATSRFVTENAVMMECDYLEERSECLDQVTLTRYQYALRHGETLPSDALAMVVELQRKLGIAPQKRVSVGATTLYRGRESRMIRHEQVILSEPFGAYYTRMTLPFSILNTEEAGELWDNNPIGVVEISMIPDSVSPEAFKSGRFWRLGTLSLHFVSGNFTTVFTLLMALSLEVSYLELRNVQATPQQMKVLEMRLKGKWPHLESITLNNRGTS